MSQSFTLQPTVALILLNDKNEVLLLRRLTRWFEGHYGLVAGCVDGNETMTQAMIREAYEEANVILKPEWLQFGCVLHTRIPERENREVVDFFFIARQWEGQINNNEPHKHDQLKFYPLNDLPQPMIPIVELGIQKALHGECYGEYGWD